MKSRDFEVRLNDLSDVLNGSYLKLSRYLASRDFEVHLRVVGDLSDVLKVKSTEATGS